MRSDDLALGVARALGLLALLGLPTSSACADFSRGPPTGNGDKPPPVGTADGGTGEVRFVDVHPLLLARCQSCHGSGGSASSTSYVLSGDVDADYATTIRFIDESSPASSRLVSKAAGIGHGGGAVIPTGSDEHDLLLQWIAQGALP